MTHVTCDPPGTLDSVIHVRKLMEAAKDQAVGLLPSSLPRHTERAYLHALMVWCAWHALRYGTPLQIPTAPEVVLQFRLDFAARSPGSGSSSQLPAHIDQLLVEFKLKSELGPWSLSTVVQRLAGLGAAHRAKGLPSPRRALHFFAGAQQLVRETDVRACSRPSIVLNLDEIVKMMEVCEADIRGIRDRALIAFIFAAGGRRRSETVVARADSLRQTADGNYVFTLDPADGSGRHVPGSIDEKPLVGVAADYLREWLRVSGITSGPIWRAVKVNNEISGQPLYDGYINKIVAKRAAQAGIRGWVTSHSLRAGFIAEADRRKCPFSEIMALAGLTDVRFATRAKQHQRIAVLGSEAANLLAARGENSTETAGG